MWLPMHLESIVTPKRQAKLGNPSNEKPGNSLVVYQTVGGGTPKPNYFQFFLGDLFIALK